MSSGKFNNKKAENNYAFIDSQNLNMGIKSMGWNLDFRKFRRYLREKYNVKTAYLFIGFIQQNQDLYLSLQKAGFVLIFKPTIADKDGRVKSAKEKLIYMDNLKHKIEYKRKSTA